MQLLESKLDGLESRKIDSQKQTTHQKHVVMFEAAIVAFEPSAGAVDLRGVPILVDSEDFEGIRIAASNLATDLEEVTGVKSCLWTDVKQEQQPRESLILVGSLERSRFVRTLVSGGKLDVNKIEGKWEAFTTSVQEDSPFASVKRVVVIAGSDKRGTIFGIYTLSEQIGVSPYMFQLPLLCYCRCSLQI